jgi:hypothetical protein
VADDRSGAVAAHERHDPLVVAALAAGDLVGAEERAARRQVDKCADCAGLFADLRAIADATTAEALAVPARPRDFRLTSAEARELDRATVRLTAMPIPSSSHAEHDPLLVAAYAAGDVAGRELVRAGQLLGTCPDCRRLHADLRALAAATTAEHLPVRPTDRDFRLTEREVARLRGWKRWLSLPRPAVLRPIGLGLATFGLAGILISSLSGGMLGMAASAPSAGGAGAGAPAIERDVQGEGASNAAAVPLLPAPSAAPSSNVFAGAAPDASNRLQSMAGDSASRFPTDTSPQPAAGGNASPTFEDSERYANRVPPGPTAAPGSSRDTLAGATSEVPWLTVASVVALGLGIVTLLVASVRSRRS